MLEEINSIRKDILEYLDVQLDLIRLGTAETLSKVFTKIVTFAIVGTFLFLILIFLSLAAAFWLAELLDSEYLGFLIISGFYVFLILIFMVLRRTIVEKPIIKATLKMVFPKLDEDEKE